MNMTFETIQVTTDYLGRTLAVPREIHVSRTDAGVLDEKGRALGVCITICNDHGWQGHDGEWKVNVTPTRNGKHYGPAFNDQFVKGTLDDAKGNGITRGARTIRRYQTKGTAKQQAARAAREAAAKI